MRFFFAWWLERLSELQPALLRQWMALPRDGVVIAPVSSPAGDIETLSVILRKHGGESELGTFPAGRIELSALSELRDQPVVLRLAPDDVLERTIDLPLAAQRDIAQVLELEMDRVTPFSAAELYWSHQVTTIDRQRGCIFVRLVMVLRNNLDPLLGALRRVGIVPRFAEIAGDAHGACIPLGDVMTHRAPMRWSWVAAASCGVLALVAAAAPLIRQSLDLATLDQEITALRPAAAEADKLRQQIDRLTNNAGLAAAERSKRAPPLEVLAAVTRIFPDDTYLTGLELRQKKLTLTGLSGAAATLIAALAGDSLFHNLAFAAPVTRLEAARGEAFTITADVEP